MRGKGLNEEIGSRNRNAGQRQKCSGKRKKKRKLVKTIPN
jgi:hypothetical protein